jgi:hypothetical protein
MADHLVADAAEQQGFSCATGPPADHDQLGCRIVDPFNTIVDG